MRFLLTLTALAVLGAPAQDVRCERYDTPLSNPALSLADTQHYFPADTLQAGVDACLAALKAKPDDPHLHYLTAEAYGHLLEYQSFSLAVQNAPDRHERDAQMREDVLKHYRLAGDFAPARYWLAIYTMDEQPEAAKAVFEGLLEDAPHLAHEGLARWYNMRSRDAPGEDNELIKKHYRQAIAAGNPYAQLRLGRHFLPPEEDATDALRRENHRDEALALFAAAAQAGLPRGESLRILLRHAQGEDVRADLRVLQEKGKTDQDYRVEALYAEGVIGWQSDEADDAARGLALLQEAARGGHPHAQALLIYKMQK